MNHPEHDQGKRRKYVDYRFTDPRGKWQHVAMHVAAVDEDMLNEGIMFDGSSIAGWKAINESDMRFCPMLASAVMDPFSAQSQLILFCDTWSPSTGQPYEPRSAFDGAEGPELCSPSGVGDTAVFGPEAEFFVFDDVQFANDMNHTFFKF